MEFCKTCIFYNKKYDELRRQHNDTLVVGDDAEKHFCVMYDQHIPPDIIGGQECDKYFGKNQTN